MGVPPPNPRLAPKDLGALPLDGRPASRVMERVDGSTTRGSGDEGTPPLGTCPQTPFI